MPLENTLEKCHHSSCYKMRYKSKTILLVTHYKTVTVGHNALLHSLQKCHNTLENSIISFVIKKSKMHTHTMSDSIGTFTLNFPETLQNLLIWAGLASSFTQENCVISGNY